MHHRAAVKAEPILRQVEPALASEQVAHLDHAQQAVVVAAHVVQSGKTTHSFGNEKSGVATKAANRAGAK